MYDTFQEEDVALAIDVFKGLDKKTPSENLPIGVSDICQNWRFDEKGNLSRRPVYAKYNATSLGANPIKYLDRIYIGTNKYLLAVYDTNLKVGNDAAGTFSNLKTDLTADLDYTGVTFKDFHYLANGTDNIIRTDGVDIKDAGCEAPDTAPSAAEGAAGTMAAGTYKYKVTYEFDGYQEGNSQSGDCSVTIGASKTVDLTDIPVANFDSYTKLLLPLEGADAATTTTDVGEFHAATFNGTAQIDTAQKKFGSSSLLLDGNSDYLTFPDHADWSFGTGDFTIDFWARFNDLTNRQAFVCQDDTTNYWLLEKYTSANGNKLRMIFINESGVTKGDYVMTNNWSVSADTWYHLAFVRNGSNAYILIDGTPQTLTETTAFGSNDVGNIAASLYVGYSPGLTTYLDGWIDEVRISKGIARWTANFTAPTTPHADAFDITGRKIYRTEADGTTYYYLTELADNTTTVYNDDDVDANLDTTITVPTDNGAPPVTKYLRLHKDRVFSAGNSTNKSRVYYSKISGIIAYPEIYPANNYIPVSPDDGDEITGIAVDPTGYLCVFKKNTIRKIFTDGDPDIWSVSEPFSKYGCVSPYSIKETPAGILYLAIDGWRLFDGQNSRLLSNSDRVNKITTDEIMLSRHDKCKGHYHDHICYLAYTDRASNVTYNNRVLLYDTLTDNFSIEHKKIDSFCTLSGSDDWGEIYYGDSQNGFVYKEETTISGEVFSKLSEFRPSGTLSNLFVFGTEESPTLELGGRYTLDRMTGSSLDDWTGSALDDFPSAYAPSGTYISPVLQLNASNLYYMYWNETLGDYGDATVALRTSTTSAGLSGTWSSEYSNALGSDITGETAQDWLQFRITLSSFDPNKDSTPQLYVKNDYLFKLTYGVTGTEVETAIDCDWRSGYLQFTPQATPVRLRRFEIDHDGSDGLLSCIWELDNESVSGIFTVNLANDTKTYKSPFPTTAFGKRGRFRLKYNDIEDLTIKAVNLLLSPQPERY